MAKTEVKKKIFFSKHKERLGKKPVGVAKEALPENEKGMYVAAEGK